MFSGLISRWTIAAFVGSSEGTRNLDRNVNSFTQLDSPARQTLTQRLAFDQFTGYVMNRVVLTDLVNRQDIGMIKPNYRVRFLLKPFQALRVTRKTIGKSLSAALRPALMSVAR